MLSGINTSAIAREDLLSVGGTRIHCALRIAIGIARTVYNAAWASPPLRREEVSIAQTGGEKGRGGVLRGLPGRPYGREGGWAYGRGEFGFVPSKNSVSGAG